MQAQLPAAWWEASSPWPWCGSLRCNDACSLAGRCLQPGVTRLRGHCAESQAFALDRQQGHACKPILGTCA